MIIKILLIATLISLILTGFLIGIIMTLVRLHSPHVLMGGMIAFLFIELFFVYSIFEPKAPVFGRHFHRGSRRSQTIALTFDDGPNEPYTSQILDILHEFNVPATFFVIGRKVEQSWQTLTREIKEGHDVGNHTFNHDVLVLKSPRSIRNEIKQTSDVIERVTGIRPKFFRAPHGWHNPWVNRIAREEGCLPIAWTLGVWDTDRPGEAVIVDRTLRGLENGCIVLLHDGKDAIEGADSSQLVKALPVILRDARRRGYQFVRLSEMMKETST
jgi:peptidoglycan/xylan/chitin deacetylase (PgdA/CDA1 family)